VGQRPAEPMPAVPAPPVALDAAPGAAPSNGNGVGPAPLPSRNGNDSLGAAAHGAEHQIAPAPDAEAFGSSVSEPDPAAATAGGGERFAFFAAFRAAAEQAREEAGIDDGRGH
jgi:hypothetical protein